MWRRSPGRDFKVFIYLFFFLFFSVGVYLGAGGGSHCRVCLVWRVLFVGLIALRGSPWHDVIFEGVSMVGRSGGFRAQRNRHVMILHGVAAARQP